MADVLREALEPMAPQIRVAFVYGSIAKGTNTASSDVDVLVISETHCPHADLVATLEEALRSAWGASFLRRSIHRRSSQDATEPGERPSVKSILAPAQVLVDR